MSEVVIVIMILVTGVSFFGAFSLLADWIVQKLIGLREEADDE